MNPFSFRTAIQHLAGLASEPHPPHVRVAAACALVDALSPTQPGFERVQRMLQEANPYEHARHKLRDLYDSRFPLLEDESSFSAFATETDPEEEDPVEEEDPL